MLWLTEFNEKVFSQAKLLANSKYSALLEMVQNIALAVCRAAYSMTTTVNEEVDQTFTYAPIKFKLLPMSQTEWASYQKGEEYQHDIVRECTTQISATIFGKDYAGSNVYIHLWRQIRELKMNLRVGIRKFDERLNNFQRYLSFCPWISGEEVGKSKLPYDKEELKEILEIAILDSQQVKLNQNNG